MLDRLDSQEGSHNVGCDGKATSTSQESSYDKQDDYLKTRTCDNVLLLFLRLGNLKREQSVRIACVHINGSVIAGIVIPDNGC